MLLLGTPFSFIPQLSRCFVSPGWGTFGFFRLRVWLVFVSVVGCGGVLVSMLGFELCGSSARYADVACGMCFGRDCSDVWFGKMVGEKQH